MRGCHLSTGVRKPMKMGGLITGNGSRNNLRGEYTRVRKMKKLFRQGAKPKAHLQAANTLSTPV